MTMNPVGLAPLVVVLAVGALVGLARTDAAVDQLVTRVSRALFGRYVDPSPERQRRLEAAYRATTYPAFAARTYLYTALAAVAGAAGGPYLTGAALLAVPTALDLLRGFPPTIVSALGLYGFQFELEPIQVLVAVTLGGVVCAGGGAGLTYLLRWELLDSDATVRARNVEEGLPRAVAFTYALSRGGVPFPQVLRTVSHNDEVLGESARELRVAIREMDTFGRDMITAVRRVGHRSPSERFKTFAENLASVLQSGGSLAAFLEDQYDRYQSAAEDRQAELLEHLATVAEAYVTILVAGVLFLVTILLVFGLTVTDTLWLVQLVTYLLVPLANAGFAVYLLQTLDELGISSNRTTSLLERVETGSPIRPDPPATGEDTADGSRPDADTAVADGGSAAVASDAPGRDSEILAQLRLYDRVDGLQRVLRSPVEEILWHPTRLLYLTVPVALVALAVRAPGAVTNGWINVRQVDDLVLQSTLFVLLTFAVVRTVYVRRIREIENAMPDLLDRLASLNDAGLSVVESIERVRGSDVGVLTPEVERLWRDVITGATIEDALVRFGRRVQTTTVARVVTLLTNAMRASGSLGPVLQIASKQVRADNRLRQERRQEMLTYLVVIYVAFAVFLLIIVAVTEVLVPSLPSQSPTAGSTGELGIGATQFARLGQVDKAAYTLTFFHAALVQALASGFVGGLLGEGTLRDGAKHAGAMLAVAYVVFLLLSAPVASLTVADTAGTGDRVVVESATLTQGGFVVVHDGDVQGTVVASTGYRQPGTYEGLSVEANRGLNSGEQLVVVAYLDSNGDRQFTPGVDRPYPARGTGVAVSVETRVQ